MAEATPNEANSNLDTTQQNADNQADDAQRSADDLGIDKGADLGKLKVPGVDVTSDYEASKKYNTGSTELSDQDIEASQTATAPQAGTFTPDMTDFQANTESSKKSAAGSPAAFRSMAKEVNPKSE